MLDKGMWGVICMRSMKKLVLMILLLAMGFCMAAPLSANESVEHQLLRGLVIKGAQAVQNKMEQQKQKETDAAGNPAAAKVTLSPLSLLSTAGLVQAVREVVGESLNAVKEQYKEEGRIYARQLGDSLAERIVQNHKVQSTLLMVKTLAWVVIIYLTLVSLLMLIVLHKLSTRNKRILELLEERQNA